jgi:hypothetical protein
MRKKKTNLFFNLFSFFLYYFLVYISNELKSIALMESFYSKPLPKPTMNSSGITCALDDYRLFFYVCPNDDRLNHDYYSTLISCLSSNQLIYLFESMLRSKRILLFSHYPSKLTKCCLALSQLIYPFQWPYSFVSLMPTSWLHDLIDSPCPYIYGCLYETMQQISLTNDNDIIRVDLDLKTIEGGNDTSPLLPFNLRYTLEYSLEYLTKFRLIKLNSNLINIAVSEAFLRVFIELFYRLPDFLKCEKISTKPDEHFSTDIDHFQRQDSGIDLKSLESIDLQQMTPTNNERKQDEDEFGYEFLSKEFLSIQPTYYILFLKEFIHGMNINLIIKAFVFIEFFV